MQIFKLVTLLSILSAVSVTVRGDVTYEIIQKWKKAHNPTTEDSQNPKTKKPTPVTTPVPVIKLAPTKPKTERSTQKKTRINPDQSNIENDWLSWFCELVQGLVTTTRAINVVVTLLLVKLTSLYMGRSQTERRQKPQRNSKVQPTSNDYNVYPDASDRHIGGVILKNGKIMGSHNRKLRGNEKKLSNGEKELLSIVEILQENRSMVIRRKLVVHTNHLNLLYQGSSRSKAIMEWRCTLEEYQIRYEGYNTPTKPTLDSQASKKSPPGASLNEIGPVGSDEHPGLNAFYRWCKAEASLYRSYTLVSKDPLVKTGPPPQSPWGQIPIDLTVKNLTNREINVFYINIGRDENYVLAGTISSKGIWTGKGFNNYRWVFEDALTAKPVLYYVPHKIIPSIPGHQFILVPPCLTSDNDCNHIGMVDAVLPLPVSRYLDQPVDAINWTLEHLSRCCNASSRHNSMLAEANTCQKYLSNIINHPENWKYRNLRIEADRFNPIWKSPLRGLLLAVGFVNDRGFCRLGRSDGPIPSDRIKDISMLSFLLAEWIWRLKKDMGRKTKFEFEWNQTTPQPTLSTTSYQRKIAAIEQQAQSELEEWSQRELERATNEVADINDALHQSELTASLDTSLRGGDPIDNGTPWGAADAGVTGLDEAPNCMTTSLAETASSSSHSSLASSEEKMSALNATPFESNLVEPTSSDGASPNPRESNNSVSAEGIPADGTLSSGSKVEPIRRRLNPSLASDPERRRQLEARLQALERRPKASTKKKAKKSRPLSSPYTNMMRWGQG